jgi:3',5'-cyclic-AMP phosphodiesterase
MALRIAQLTDTHLFADPSQTMLGCATNQTFQRAIAKLHSLTPQPDLILLTGDLSQDDSAASYEHLQTHLAPLNIPTYWLPGNHDQNLEALFEILSEPPCSPSKIIHQGGWQILLLGTMLPQQVQGRLAQEALDWLEEQLQAQPSLPTLVALHHHPLPIGSAWMDRIGLENGEAFLAVCHRYPQVKLVLNGHIHQAFQGDRHGVTFLGSPSTCVQFKAQQDVMAVDESRGPGFRLLDLQTDGRFATEVVWL